MSSISNHSSRSIIVDGRTYEVEVITRVHLNSAATRIIIPTLIMNDTAKNLVRVCVESIQQFTLEDVEIWVVDNNSEQTYANWLKQFNSQINLVLNRTEPINPFRKCLGVVQLLRQVLRRGRHHPQMRDGSYANAIGLELGRHYIDPATQSIFTMHYDTLVTKYGWLAYFKSKLTERSRAIAFRRDKIRIEALHIAGLLLDFTLFEPLKMSFLPNLHQERYPDLPEYDVGDQLTLQLRANGLGDDVLSNTFNNPEFSEWVPVDSPFRQMLSCDLCFDDQRDVIFMHLGRGIPKLTGKHKRSGLFPDQWIEFADEYLLRSTSPNLGFHV